MLPLVYVTMVAVVVLGFYVPPTAKVIRRRDLGLKSHPNDWRSLGSNTRLLVYKASSFTTTPRRLVVSMVLSNLRFRFSKIKKLLLKLLCVHF